jgi:hypothetical protein
MFYGYVRRLVGAAGLAERKPRSSFNRTATERKPRSSFNRTATGYLIGRSCGRWTALGPTRVGRPPRPTAGRQLLGLAPCYTTGDDAPTFPSRRHHAALCLLTFAYRPTHGRLLPPTAALCVFIFCTFGLLWNTHGVSSHRLPLREEVVSYIVSIET